MTWESGVSVVAGPRSALRAYLAELAARDTNFDLPPEMMTPEHGWTVDGTRDVPIGTEPTGPPVVDGLFARARQALINYDFSDPRIVEGHFDPETDFVGRDMLLELKVLGFRFLSGCRVHSVRDETGEGSSTFGFRYDTLDGHIEQGFEWFLLTKDHDSGQVHFTIEAHWRLGDFPNLWTRLGFRLVGGHYRHLWRERAAGAAPTAGPPADPSRTRGRPRRAGPSR